MSGYLTALKILSDIKTIDDHETLNHVTFKMDFWVKNSIRFECLQ